jgi:excisionase family DNA binding protein
MEFLPTTEIIARLVGPEEAAKLLGVSPGTLSVWRTTGRYNLPYVKIGQKVKYKIEDLRAFIERRTRNTGEAA